MTKIRVTLLQNGTLRQGNVDLIDSWRKESEDSLSATTLPKYDSFTDYDFFIFRTVDVNISEHASETFKIAAFLGKNFLFTVHRRPLRAIDDVCNRLPSDRRILE